MRSARIVQLVFRILVFGMFGIRDPGSAMLYECQDRRSIEEDREGV